MVCQSHMPCQRPAWSTFVQCTFETPPHAMSAGRKRQWELLLADREGLRRKLTTQLSPEAASLAFSWDVADCIGIYWRPNFDVSMYPYLPAHITRPKEVKKIFLVRLPEKCYLAVRGPLLTLDSLPPRLQGWRQPGHCFVSCDSKLPGLKCHGSRYHRWPLHALKQPAALCRFPGTSRLLLCLSLISMRTRLGMEPS